MNELLMKKKPIKLCKIFDNKSCMKETRIDDYHSVGICSKNNEEYHIEELW
jgi:hypothetical protein